MFAALAHRNYRLWFSGACVSNIGTWMQRTAQDWLVLTELTDHSGTAVGVTTACQYAPMILLSPYAGLLADRMSKRVLLFCTQTLMCLSALVLGTLVVTDTVRLWHVIACALALGVAAAVDNPVRQAFVSQVVPRQHLAGAVGLNSAAINLGKLVGPSAAGLVIGFWGTGPAFLINAASCVAIFTGLARMSSRDFYHQARAPAGRGQVREGFRYLGGRSDLIMLFVMTGVASTFTMNFPITNALMATETFHLGAQSFGLLGSTLAVGSLIGALNGARRASPSLRIMTTAGLCVGIAMVVSAILPEYWMYAAFLIAVGWCSMWFSNVCTTSVQLSTAPVVRGRVLALYMLVRQGTVPLGAPVIGWVAAQWGARWGLAGAGLIATATAVTAIVVLIRVPSVDATFRREIEADHHGQEPVAGTGSGPTDGGRNDGTL